MSNQAEFKNRVSKCKKVIQKFGTTMDFTRTNFIMPDGKLISGRKKPGERWEHTDVSLAFSKTKSFPKQLNEMERFMKDCGAIRFRKYPGLSGDRVMITAITKPNEKQIKKIIQATKDAIRFYGGMETETEHLSCESNIENPTGLDIRRFISK